MEGRNFPCCVSACCTPCRKKSLTGKERALANRENSSKMWKTPFYRFSTEMLCTGYSHIKWWPRVKNYENHAQFTKPPPLNGVVPCTGLPCGLFVYLFVSISL